MMGHNLVRHGGQVRGFRSEFARFVDHRLTIIVLMNMDDVDWQTIVRGVARSYIPAAPKDKPDAKKCCFEAISSVTCA